MSERLATNRLYETVHQHIRQSINPSVHPSFRVGPTVIKGEDTVFTRIQFSVTLWVDSIFRLTVGTQK